MKRANLEIPLRVIILYPPAGVIFALQREKSGLASSTMATRAGLSFELMVRIATKEGEPPNLLGSYVQGSRTERDLINLGDKMKAVFKTVAPYLEDEMNLPVENLETAIPFYETVMGFKVISRKDLPFQSAVLTRDGIQIGLAENGGDPTQEGCFFEVDSAEAAFAELKSNGLKKEEAGFRIDKHGETSYKIFFVIAPDGLCYCLGERL